MIHVQCEMICLDQGILGEKSTDMLAVGEIINKKISDYNVRTGRKLHVEIEPGTYVVANAGYQIAQVDDIVDTGPD